jgi:hypothetical protein
MLKLLASAKDLLPIFLKLKKALKSNNPATEQ